MAPWDPPLDPPLLKAMGGGGGIYATVLGSASKRLL